MKWMILLFSLMPSHIYAIDTSTAFCGTEKDKAEEILLELRVESLLTFDFDGLLCDNVLYLPVSSLMSRLNISYNYSGSKLKLEVNFPDEERLFLFDLTRLQVRTPDGSVEFDEYDVLIPNDRHDIYLKKELLEEIFSLNIHFDYRSLRILVFSMYELPVIRDLNSRLLYENFQSSEKEIIVDKDYAAQRNLLKGWVLDWSLSSSHSSFRQNYSFGFATGGEVMGGELYVSSRGTVDEFRWDHFRSRWRYPVYSTPVVRQIVIGDQIQENLFSQGTLHYQGIEITNRPHASRSHFREFTFSDVLHEGWDVAIYTNGRLADFTRGNETGSYVFNEPVNYGSNKFTLRYYDPEGFSHEENHFFTIPRSLLPSGEFEYSLTGGRYRFEPAEFARAHVNMGITSFLTMGGGYHMVAAQISVPDHSPFLHVSMQPVNRLIFEGSHTFGYFSEGSLRYFFLNGRSMSAEVRKYYRPSRYNLTGRSLEGAFNASFPLNAGPIRLSTFVSARGSRYHQHQDINLYGGIVAGLPFGYQLQLRSSSMIRDQFSGPIRRIRSDISITLSKRIMRRLLLRPGLDYDHRTGSISGFRLDASSRLSRQADFSLSVHRDQLFDQYRFQLAFRYNFSFARYHSRARMTGSGNLSMNQTTSGSLMLDSKNGDFYTDNRTRTRTASLRLEPYLVMDDTGRKVPIRESAKMLSVEIYSDGRKQSIHRDGEILTNLTPYQEYVVRVNAENLDNPLWKLESETFRIQVIPNVVNRLPIPMVAVGEVSGLIKMKDDEMEGSLRGLSVELFRIDGTYSEVVTTYSNGRFYYVGLMPGEYIATLDARQLSNRSLTAVRDSITFTINTTENGDIVDGLTLGVSSDIKVVSTKLYAIQIGAFRQKFNVVAMVEYIERNTNFDIVVIYDPETGFYNCRIGIFDSVDSVKEHLYELKREHAPLFRDAFIIRLDN